MLMGLMMAFSACAKKDYLITIKTSYGDMKVILYDQTPKHKENFVKLAKSGAYDSTTFHRVIEGFMIQGGDVDAKPDSKVTIDYTIDAEFVDTLFHRKGALAAARKSDNINPKKASSGSQFYIVQGVVYDAEELTTDAIKLNQYLGQLFQKPGYDSLREELSAIYYQKGEKAYAEKLMALKPVMEQEFNTTFDKKLPADRLEAYTTVGGAPHLDDQYTVFGQVVEGLDVIDKIAAVETRAEKPLQDVYFTMEVEEVNVKNWKSFTE